MNYEQEAIGQLFSLTIGGTMFAVQMATTLTKELYHFFKKAAQEGSASITKHQISMKEFLKHGNGVEVFNIKESDFEVFQAAAKKSPLYYYAGALDQTSPKGERLLSVFVSPADIPIVNQIIELNHLDVISAGSAKVSTAEPEQEIPPMPDVDESLLDMEEAPAEDLEGSWLEFIGPNGEYGTPEENMAKREAAEHAIPTQPVSDTENASPSANSSGSLRAEENGSQDDPANQQEQPQTTALPSAATGRTEIANSVITGDGFVIYPDIAVIEAVKSVTAHGEVSVGLLQQELHVSQERALELIDKMENLGVISPQKDILISFDDFLDNELNKFHETHLPPTQGARESTGRLSSGANSAQTVKGATSAENRRPIREQLDEVKRVRAAQQLPDISEVATAVKAAQPITP